MKVAYERRACNVLYGVLRRQPVGWRVMLPANVCAVVPQTCVGAGAEIEYVDVGDDLMMDRQRCLSLLRSNAARSVLLVFVRTYGAALDESAFFAEIKRAAPDVWLVDDRCLCAPVLDGTGLDPCADVTLFSTGYAKYADLGFGGVGFLRNEVPYEPPEIEPSAEWFASGAPPVAWKHYVHLAERAVAEASAHKTALNAIYERMIPSEAQFDPRYQRWRFNVAVAEPDALVAALFDADLFASRHYAPPDRRGTRDFPRAARLHACVVNLFNDRYFDTERAARAGAIVAAHVGQHGPAAWPPRGG